MEQKTPKDTIVQRSVKHAFSPEERATLHTELVNALSNESAATAEFDNVKAQYKARITEAESTVAKLLATITSGFELRTKDCRVVYRPEIKKKELYVVETGELAITEDMTQDDYQLELIQAEAPFSNREEIVLWDANNDKGILVVGQLNGRWYTALRANLGVITRKDRLNGEAKATNKRFDALKQAEKSVNEWLVSAIGKDNAAGFKEPISNAIDPHREREE